MRFTEKNSTPEFVMLNDCIEATVNRGELSQDDGESLTFFLELVREALTNRSRINS